MDLVDKAKNYVSEKVAEKVAEMEKPEATVMEVDVKKFSFDSISYHAKVNVTNPYKVPIPIMEIAYVVKSAGRIVATGTIPDPGSLKPKSTTMVDVPAKVPHSAILSLLRDIAADWDIDYTLELGFIIDLPVFGNFTIPLTYSGEYKLPTLSDLWRGDQEPEKKEKEGKEKKDEKEEKEGKEKKDEKAKKEEKEGKEKKDEKAKKVEKEGKEKKEEKAKKEEKEGKEEKGKKEEKEKK